MANQLSIYNGALNILGERKLADLTENREPLHQLNDIWSNDFIKRVLQMGQWNFAARAVKLEASTTVTPDFGFQYAFDKADDFIRTMMVCYDEYFDLPITQYSDEAKFIFCDTDVIYFKYVSDDDEFGADFSLWPPNFTEMVEHYMAYKVAPRIAGLDFKERTLEAKFERAKSKATGTDAMEAPAKFAPQGGWSGSRSGRRGTRNDRGNRRQLIG